MLLTPLLAFVTATASLTLAGASASSVALAADASSDIPGVPLPGSVAAGRLGGAIYDVVYSLVVAPGTVIVASVTGTAGTDFDIYLFDSSATTVLSETGLQTKSTGPTSTESISWPSRFGGTYYIDLNGATDIEGDYRLTVQTVPDPTPPSVSIVLAGGRPSTNQLLVPVMLTATDDLSGVTEMALSGDGVTYTEWEPFQPSATWTFASGDGPRTVWAKVKNGVGLESAPAHATVAIDTLPPSAIDFAPAPGSSVAGLRPRFTVAFNEPMDPASWTDLGLIVQSATGVLIAGGYSYDQAARTGSFVPSDALQPGASYIVTLGTVRDVAGNRVSSPGSWSVTPLSPTTLAVSAAASVILRGGSTQIDVVLDGAPPASIDALSARGSGEFTPLTVIPVPNGRASLVVAPEMNTTYRFRYEGAFGIAPAQKDVRVLVRRSVALVGRSTAVVSRARVGTAVKLVAAIDAPDARISLSFRLYRFDAVRRIWVYAGSHGRNTDTAGRATLAWTPTRAGSYYWRAWVASTDQFANNVSPVYRWSVSR